MKYLAITGARSEDEVRAYLYSYATPVDGVVKTTFQGRVWSVIEVPDERAEYQADRFRSGMIGASIHDTAFDAAVAVIDRL